MKKILMIFLSIMMTLIILPVSLAETSHKSNEVKVTLNHDSRFSKGTDFTIYGISRSYYEKALELKLEQSIVKTKEWLKEEGLTKARTIAINSKTSSEFTLSRYDEAGNKMYYLLLQNVPDREGINGKEMYEVFPSFISFDELEDDFLEITTKRVFMIETPYFFKYSSEKEEKPLANAEFSFYKLNNALEKEYLTNIDPIEWQNLEDSKDAWQFKSDENGLVSLPDLGLDLGIYYFEETRAPTNYIITKESQQVTLVIEETDKGVSMTINDELLIPMQAGELPSEVIEKGYPRVLNDLSKGPPGKDEPPTEKETPEKTPENLKPIPKHSNQSNFLPKTGEKKWAFSSIGLVLIIIAFVYKKRRIENE